MCKQADFPTLKELRCVCKLFNELASRELFHQIFVTLLPNSLYKIRQLRLHPVLCNYVREILYITGRLNPRYKVYPNWVESALHVSTGDVAQSFVSKWRRFKYLCEKQENMIEERAVYRVFLDCLRRLPNLESIRLIHSPESCCECRPGRVPILSELQSATLLSPATALHQNHRVTEISSPHLTLFRALGHSGKQLKYFQLEGMPQQLWRENFSNLDNRPF